MNFMNRTPSTVFFTCLRGAVYFQCMNPSGTTVLSPASPKFKIVEPFLYTMYMQATTMTEWVQRYMTYIYSSPQRCMLSIPHNVLCSPFQMSVCTDWTVKDNIVLQERGPFNHRMYSVTFLFCVLVFTCNATSYYFG